MTESGEIMVWEGLKCVRIFVIGYYLHKRLRIAYDCVSLFLFTFYIAKALD